MNFLLSLTDKKALGQIPILNQNGKIQFMISGNINQHSHTLYLKDIHQHELGRLYYESNRLMIASYTVDVVNHSLVHVKKVNSHLTNLFFITQLNYWVNGSIKQGSYSFRFGIKEVAHVETRVTPRGLGLYCHIKRPEDVPFILLISILFTQWHVTPLQFPKLPTKTFNFETSAN